MSEDSNPLVSVVIPTYNRPELLSSAIKSVLNQTYNNIQLIIVDDHSTTPIEEVLKEQNLQKLSRVEYIRHQKNQGANVARNTGIKHANGTFIAFLDDDDRWVSEKLERQVLRFRNLSEEVGVVYTGQKRINEAGETTSVTISNISGNVTQEILCGKSISPFSSVMVRANVVEQAGLPDERFPSWQDKEWYIRLSRYCLFESIPEPLVIRLMGSHDQIGDDYETKRDTTYPLFIQKHGALASEYGQLCEQKMLAYVARSLGKEAMKQQQYQYAQAHLLDSIFHYPLHGKTYFYLIAALSGQTGVEIAQKFKRKYETSIKYKSILGSSE